MNITIEELETSEIVAIVISDAVSYFDIVEVSDTSFEGKNGYIPTVNEATGKMELKAPTSTSLASNQYNQNNITFKNPIGDYFGTITTPITGVLTFDNADAVTGGISIIYYQNATLQMPSVWRTIGTFVPNELNKIYLERDSEGFITCNIVGPTISNEPSATAPTITVTDIPIIIPSATIPTITITNP